MLGTKVHKSLYYLTLLSTFFVSFTNAASKNNTFRSVAYFPNYAIYQGFDFHPKSIPVKSLTHLIYAFAMPRGDGKILFSDPYADLEDHYVDVPASQLSTMPTDEVPKQYKNISGVVSRLEEMKKENRNLKVMLSVGGYSYSNNGTTGSPFSNLTRCAESRLTFARSAVDIMNAYKFDGLDIDWEYPYDETEKQNYVELINLIRHEFDDKSKTGGNEYLISIATPSNTKKLETFDLTGLSNAGVDFFNFMAYDYAGPSYSDHIQYTTNWNSPSDPSMGKYNTTGPLQVHMDQVPAKKINVGITIYAQIFTKNNTNQTIGSPYTEGAANTTGCKNLPDKDKKLNYNGTTIGAYYDNDTAVYTYETTESLSDKVDIIMKKQLGGAMFWDVTQDRDMPDARADKGSLIGTYYDKVKDDLEMKDNYEDYVSVSVTSPGLDEGETPKLDPPMSMPSKSESITSDDSDSTPTASGDDDSSSSPTASGDDDSSSSPTASGDDDSSSSPTASGDDDSSSTPASSSGASSAQPIATATDTVTVTVSV